MKIAYIYTALTTLGGVDRIVSTKANYLADELGHEIYIITDSQAGRPPAFPLSPRVKHIDLETDFDEQYHQPNIIRRFLCYRRLMKQYRQRLSNLLNELRCDVVCTTCGRDLDFLTSLKDGSKKVGESHIAKPFVRNFHLMEQRGFPYNLMARYWRAKQERAIKQLDAFVVLTQHDAQSWASVRKANIIPNPVTVAPILSDNENSKTIISVGRLDEQKGYDLLIKAWSLVAPKHPDWQIRIYGHGSLHDALEQMAKDAKVSDSFHLCGATQNVVERYSESAFYVMSSRFEGFGLVLTEAMSCGLPCVSFDCPHGPHEIITDGEDGFLIKPGDCEALAEKISYLIEHPDERQRMGQNGMETAKRFSADVIMLQWVKLFDGLTNK